MPWCPKCKSEYREGFTVCADCGGNLISEEEFQKLAETKQEVHEEDAEMERSSFPGRPYEESSRRASENRSAAWALLLLGTTGLLVVILGMAGILPLKVFGSYLLYGVMGAVFILFIVSGAVSMRNAKIFEVKAKSENSLRDTLLEWCRDNIRRDEIDGELGAAEGISEEELYFKRFECIKARLNHQFVNLDQDFLDMLIDNYVYESVFEENGEKTE